MRPTNRQKLFPILAHSFFGFSLFFCGNFFVDSFEFLVLQEIKSALLKIYCARLKCERIEAERRRTGKNAKAIVHTTNKGVRFCLVLDQRKQMNMFVVHAEEKKLNPKKNDDVDAKDDGKEWDILSLTRISAFVCSIIQHKKQVYEVIILTYLSLVSVAHFNERKNFTVIEPLQSANVNPTNLTSMAKKN